MALKPSDWSAVVIGRWNRAILTPRGIAQRVFRLPEGTPIQVLVPIDAVGMNSVIVKHGEFQATVDDSRLQIHLEHGNFDALERAMVSGGPHWLGAE